MLFYQQIIGNIPFSHIHTTWRLKENPSHATNVGYYVHSLSHTHTHVKEKFPRFPADFFYVIIDINIGIIYDKKARLDRFFGKLLSSNYLIQNHCFISCPHMQISECVNRIQTYRLIATQLHNPLHEFRVWNILSCIFHWLFKETFKLISCPLKSKSEKHLSRWLKQNYWWL